eukprot:TRINITY_DN142_c0_g1_i3.p2 TRINITY_DN142_c0_g1~~TRINITY_DN142_c0_g1_i3.p2  ORF type:complete len:148 (-),score=4.10 TRINITY_DN142_c0_g1_i3:3285-3728(-)
MHSPKKNFKKKPSKVHPTPIRMKVPTNTDLPSIATIKPQNQQKNILSVVHTFMNKPTPPKYDVSPTTFSSTVAHLKIALAFMSYTNFKTFISKYMRRFKFDRHGPDIARVTVLIYNCPRVESEVDSGFESSYYLESLLLDQCILLEC